MCISIHAPTRGATLHYSIDIKTIIFQSTLPREERLLAIDKPKLVQSFQSTLPREERLPAPFTSSNPIFISIHAPTRGATNGKYIHFLYASISIHAPTRGATMPYLIDAIASSFQSTLPREERHCSNSCHPHLYNFNPRSHERSDLH